VTAADALGPDRASSRHPADSSREAADAGAGECGRGRGCGESCTEGYVNQEAVHPAYRPPSAVDLKQASLDSALTGTVRLLAVGDPADGRRRADEQAAIPHGRRRHAHLAERVPPEYL
jgi:hypothetical protein